MGIGIMIFRNRHTRFDCIDNADTSRSNPKWGEVQMLLKLVPENGMGTVVPAHNKNVEIEGNF